MSSVAAELAMVPMRHPLLMVLMGVRILILVTLVSGLLLRAGLRRGRLGSKPKSAAISGAGKPPAKAATHRKSSLHFSS